MQNVVNMRTAYPLSLPPQVLVLLSAADQLPILPYICKDVLISIILRRQYVPQHAGSLQRLFILDC